MPIAQKIEQKKQGGTSASKPKKKQSQKTAVQDEQIASQNKIEQIRPGMMVKVYEQIRDLDAKGKERERIQIFEGIVIAKKHRKETGATMTVRKETEGIGVEKIYPLHSPLIKKIEIVKQYKVRRAKLYFLRRGYNKHLKEKK